MLVRLLPDQIIREWDVIKHAIKEANHERLFAEEQTVREYLRHILAGEMQVWAITDDEEEAFLGVGVTRFSYDHGMSAKRLEIFALYSYRDVPAKVWAACFVALKRFAKAHRCDYIIALSDQEAVIHLAERMGGDVAQHFIVFKA
jgi:hypothetical protein